MIDCYFNKFNKKIQNSSLNILIHTELFYIHK